MKKEYEMTKDEALKLALEALNIVKLHFTQNRHVNDAIIELEQQAEQEPVACRFCHSKKGSWTWQCYHCGEIDDVQQPAPPLPVQEPKKRCCDHDSDCSVHNGNALPVGPCDCSQTFISSPDLGIVVTVSYQLAVRELAKLVENNFGQMPRNDEWADKVLLVRDTFEAARNKGAKP